jgi:hypothetical protein
MYTRFLLDYSRSHTASWECSIGCTIMYTVHIMRIEEYKDEEGCSIDIQLQNRPRYFLNLFVQVIT